MATRRKRADPLDLAVSRSARALKEHLQWLDGRLPSEAIKADRAVRDLSNYPLQRFAEERSAKCAAVRGQRHMEQMKMKRRKTSEA